MSNSTFSNCKINFYFSADPPALSVVPEGSNDAFWFEITDDYQLIALADNLDCYLNKRMKLLLAKERAGNASA